MEGILLICITILAGILIVHRENRKLKKNGGLHRPSKIFSEECVKLLKYEKYGCYQLTGMQYKCLKQSDYGIHHGYAVVAENSQCDNSTIIIKRQDNGKIIACVEKESGRQLYEFITRNKGKVHALYYIWQYGKGRIYGCAYIKDKEGQGHSITPA